MGKPKVVSVHPLCSPSPSIWCLVSWSLITRGFLNQLTPNLSLLGDGKKSQRSVLGWCWKGEFVVDSTWETTKFCVWPKMEFTFSTSTMSTKLGYSLVGEVYRVCGIFAECNSSPWGILVPSALVSNSTYFWVLLPSISFPIYLYLGLVRGGVLSPKRSEWILTYLPLLSLGLVKNFYK